MTFQSLSNLVYSRGGIALNLESGKYYEFTAEDYAKLPDVAKRKLKPLDEVEITKPALSPVSTQAEQDAEPVKGKKGRK